MDKAKDRNKYKAVLETKRDELLQARCRAKGSIAIEHGGDPIDQAVSFQGRELAANNLRGSDKLLGKICEALKKLNTHKFGICESCGEPISQKRLDAVPWAALCINCKEMLSPPAIGTSTNHAAVHLNHQPKPRSPERRDNSEQTSVFDRIVDDRRFVGIIYPAQVSELEQDNHTNGKRPRK